MPSSRSLSRKQTFKAARWVVVCIALWGAWTLSRSVWLLANAHKIAEHSAGFSRDYYLGDTNSIPITYLVLGDSTAAGWGASRLEETYPYRVAQAIAIRGYRVHVVNVAVGGARLGDLLQMQTLNLKRVRPDLVSVSIGANDATHGTDLEEYRNQTQTLLNLLNETGVHLVLWSNTPDMHQTPALPLPLSIRSNNFAKRQNAALEVLLKATSKRRVPVELVDLYGQGKLVYREDPNLYAADLFHPSDKGYDRWTHLFIGQLKF